MISTKQIAWAAGFLEGEGSFRFECSPQVSASQVQKEPLERLHEMFGGKIRLRQTVKNTLSNKPIWIWTLPAQRSAEVMLTLYVLMSPRRKEQIAAALAKWRKTIRKRTKFSLYCSRGHQLTKENTYMYKDYKKCRTCRQMWTNGTIWSTAGHNEINLTEEDLWSPK